MSSDKWLRDPALGQPLERGEVGGKAWQLGLLMKAGAKVPRFVALGAGAHDSGDLEGLLPALSAAGFEGKRMAVRSSGLGEDGSNASFAGQFDSVLNVEFGDLPAAVRKVWDSASGERAQAYAGGGPAMRMGVVIQEMVDADVAGVAFTADPIDGDEGVVVISAVPGLGEKLVSGEVDADTWRVRGSRIKAVCRGLPCLADAEIFALAAHFKELEGRLGGPQDLEWALGPGRELHLLQARPITTLPQGELRIWDNSNIIESYSGLTLPLTFSYVRGAYEEAYKVFARMLGFTEKDIQDHGELFSDRLGLIRGHVYYNLICWYKSLTYLPGYRFNRAFMEKMMGVREALPIELKSASSGSRWADLLRLLKCWAGLLRELWRVQKEVTLFHARMDRVLKPCEDSDLRSWDADRLASLYADLEKDLLAHWKAPLSNDFFAMVYFGALSGMIEKWRPGLPKSVVNDLLCGEGGIISTEPAKLLAALAREIKALPALHALFSGEPSDAAVWQGLDAFPGFKAKLSAYLKRFGARCAMELKLETVPLDDDPPALCSILRGYLAQELKSEAENRARELAIRASAEADVLAGMGILRKALLGHVLRNTRRMIRNRENLRFERTRSFAVVRRIFLGLGGRFSSKGLLNAERDVFYLTKEEIFGALNGNGVDSNFKALVELRKSDYARFAALGPPPERFTTRGPLCLAPIPSAAEAGAMPGALQGLGCCPGVVRARVRLVRDPRQAGDLKGRILVAERTDPGWTLLFPAAQGILVERGSLLSHSAIVAREMGLPCVVSIPGLMATLADGEEVEMDGANGSIRRVGAGEAR